MKRKASVIKDWKASREDKLPTIKALLDVTSDKELQEKVYSAYCEKYDKEPPVELENYASAFSKYPNHAANSANHFWFFQSVFDLLGIKIKIDKKSFEQFKQSSREEFEKLIDPKVRAALKHRWIDFPNTSTYLRSHYLNFETSYEEWQRNCSVDQKNMYLSMAAARRWDSVLAAGSYDSPATQQDCVRSLQKLLDSRFWSKEIEKKPFDRVVILGAAGTYKEKRIIQDLIKYESNENFGIWFVDTSNYMLSKSDQMIQSLRKEVRQKLKEVLFLTCDFMDLPRHNDWFSKFYAERTVYFILGGTFGNIEEKKFFDSMAQIMCPDDLLVINVDTFGDENPDEFISEKVREYRGHEEILALVTTPIRESKSPPLDPISDIERRCTVRSYKAADPQSKCDIPGSYSIQFIWDDPEDVNDNHISLSVSKKYEKEALLTYINDRNFEVLTDFSLVSHHVVCRFPLRA